MTASPRVLQVAPTAAGRAGGVPAFVGGMTSHLLALGAEVEVYSTDLALAPWGWLQRQQRIETTALEPGIASSDPKLFPARFPRRLGYSPALAAALREKVADFDVVHVHNLWQHPQLAAFRAARDAGVPYIVSPHGGLDPFLRRRGRARKWVTTKLWQGSMFEGARMIHVTTDAEADLIADIAPGVARAVVPCGLDTGEFAELPAPGGFRERHLGGYSGRLVLFLGRITEKKGVDVLVRAFAEARRSCEARLAIVGPDDTGSVRVLERLAAELGVGGEVSFIDALYGPERLEALADTDVWALSSHTENFGIAAVEALAAGCAVLVSPAVNIARDIVGAGAGEMAEAEPTAFGGALASLLDDDQRREQVRARAPEFARRYDWSVVAPEMLAVYRAAGDTVPA